MNYASLRRFGKESLETANVENAGFDSMCLLEYCTGCNRTRLTQMSSDSVGNSTFKMYKELIKRRIGGEPLQYILGEWQFMGMRFIVGPGVLIPRPETEILVEAVLENIKTKGSITVFDLCAGTGCIGISFANRYKEAQVYLVEKSPEAFDFLNINLKMHKLKNTKAVQADISHGFRILELPEPDIIVTNPPYIETAQLNTLQAEVMKEPQSALDGGCDGLYFYRILAKQWMPYIKPGGLMAVECGDSQADAVAEIFSREDNKVEIVKDFSRISRAVIVYINK